ncbi:ArsR family transcriptional regulator [Brevibacillus laterosporus PE36]|nr:ArsR family transcriptional regulator [Brevibacillus laterosporus PE36]
MGLLGQHDCFLINKKLADNTYFLYYFSMYNNLVKDKQRIKILKALADETRLQIIRVLFQKEQEAKCGEVGELCHMSKSNASYHFRTLREAGLIHMRNEGQSKFLRINQETFEKYLPTFLETL